MATDDATDLFMKFVLNGAAIPGESTTNLSPSGSIPNKLTTGFTTGRMFEIDSFTLKAGLSDSLAQPDETAARALPAGFQAWRAGKSAKYPVDMQPVSFTRSIDKSSATLIQNCIDCVAFDSASLIKRKAAGGQAAGEVFLRMDFLGVLVIGVDWSNDDGVQETCQFICRSAMISYRPQLSDGTLAAPISRFWSMVAGTPQPGFS
jgi:type VI protein secretion system component Hcp